MTPEQIAEAQQMAKEWMEKHPAAAMLEFSQRPVQLAAGLAFLSILLGSLSGY